MLPEIPRCDSMIVAMEQEVRCELRARHSGLHQVVIYWQTDAEGHATEWDTEAWSSEPEKG